jgi:hypothetical protein
MAFQGYQFLRYFIPGSLYVIYLMSFVIPNLAESIACYLLNKPEVLLGIVGGAFGASLSIGYVIYSFHDTALYNHLAMREKWRDIPRYLKKEIATWKNLSNEERKEFLDLLYLHSGEDTANQQFSATIRGMWSHFNARIVCSLWASLLSVISFVVLYALDQAAGTGVFNLRFFHLGGCYVYYWHLCALVITLVSTFLLVGARRPYKEAVKLEYYFVKTKIADSEDLRRLERILLRNDGKQ